MIFFAIPEDPPTNSTIISIFLFFASDKGFISQRFLGILIFLFFFKFFDENLV